MTKLRKEFSVACNSKVLSTYRLPGADLVLFACSHQTMLGKIDQNKLQILYQNSGFSTKICRGVFEQLARYTMRYQESDLQLGLYSSLTSANSLNLATLLTLFYFSTLL